MKQATAERVLHLLKLPDGGAFVVTLSPLAEGMNMGVYIGFKHINYLIEHAVGTVLHEAHAGISELYYDEQAALQIVGSKTRYLSAVMIDEAVHVAVELKRSEDAALEIKAHVVSERSGQLTRLARSTLRAVLLNKEGQQMQALPERLLAAVAAPSSGSL